MNEFFLYKKVQIDVLKNKKKTKKDEKNKKQKQKKNQTVLSNSF
jgi:hypothetical protein